MTIQIQEEESKAGAICSDIAAKIHRHQVEAGMAEYIYHRPGHGQGQFFVGHQSPFIALGDYTPLEENMTFSMEPGLYDAGRGFGINPSDNLRVTGTRTMVPVNSIRYQSRECASSLVSVRHGRTC